MKAIFKYPLTIEEKCSIELPKDALVLRVEAVNGLPFLWAIVNTDEDHPKETLCLEMYKTGQPIGKQNSVDFYKKLIEHGYLTPELNFSL